MLERLEERHHRAVETLDMTHLEFAVIARRCGDQVLSLLEGGRNRLLHEHMHARFEQRFRHGVMRGGRRGDRHRLRAALKERLHAVQRAPAEFLRGAGRLLGGAIHDAHEYDAGKRRIEPRVVVTEIARAHDAGANC